MGNDEEGSVGRVDEDELDYINKMIQSSTKESKMSKELGIEEI